MSVLHCMLLVLEFHPLDWLLLDVFERCQHPNHLLRRNYYIHQSPTILHLSSDVKSDRSVLLISLCWCCLFFSWSCFSELAELKLLGQLGFWFSLKMGLLCFLILDVAVFTDACCCSFIFALKYLIEFIYPSLQLIYYLTRLRFCWCYWWWKF